MSWQFDARIEDRNIHCTLTSPIDIADPTFCFSLMIHGVVISGGEMTDQTAGYCEVMLPPLKAGVPHDVVVAYQNPNYRPVNRAWLPLGACIRHADGIEELPPLPAGVDTGPWQPPLPYEGLRLLPAPTEWQPTGGSRAFFAFTPGHPALAQVDALTRRLGLVPMTSLGEDGVDTLNVKTDPSMEDEAYRLSIEPEGISVTAATDTGVFYALISLLHLREAYGRDLLCGTITDSPEFSWRGQHLDCARHFFETDTISRLLDVMALFKLNRFHWHFADDEAFRLETDAFPELWQKTAMRGQNHLIPGVFGGGVSSGGSYSKTDVANLVAHAKSLHIDILPEIEFPAHAMAMNKAIRGMRDQGDTGTEVSVQGYGENTLNPAMAKTWEVTQALAAEIIAMFPFKHLHLGCDELPPGAWAGSPAVERLKSEEGLQTSEDVQNWAIAKLAKFVAAKGARPAAWEEAGKGSLGGIGSNAILFSWTGTEPGAKYAKMGYDVVMCPAQHAYFDMVHSPDPGDWGAAWAGFVSFDDTINWDPRPADSELAKHVIGVEGTFWGEFTTRDEEMEPMIAPRILGLSLQAWNPDHGLDVEEFRALSSNVAQIFEAIGWQRHHGA